jgi:hypothetical protein
MLPKRGYSRGYIRSETGRGRRRNENWRGRYGKSSLEGILKVNIHNN